MTHPQYLHYVAAGLVLLAMVYFAERLNGAEIRSRTWFWISGMLMLAKFFLGLGNAP